MEKLLTYDIIREHIESLFSNTKDKHCNPIERIGIELETYPIQKNDAGHYTQVDTNVLFESLNEVIAGSEDYSLIRTGEDYRATNFHFTSGNSIQFEPGGQLELVLGPQDNIQDINVQLGKIKNILTQVSKLRGFEFRQQGMQQWIPENDISLQLEGKHKRYLSMLDYFGEISPYGKQMMLQTCSMHVNLDIGNSEEIICKRLLLSNLLVPYVSAIFANSPYRHRGGLYKSYRTYLWQHLDNIRSGVLEIFKSKQLQPLQSIIEAYMEFVLEAPVIFRINNADTLDSNSLSFRSWMESDKNAPPPTIDDLGHHLTLLFPEVRVKGYLELRTPDCPPEGWELPIVQFYTSLLYDEKNCDKALSIICNDPIDFNTLMKASVDGLDTDLLYPVCYELMQLAELSVSDSSFLGRKEEVNDLHNFAERFTYQRKTFSDLYLI